MPRKPVVKPRTKKLLPQCKPRKTVRSTAKVSPNKVSPEQVAPFKDNSAQATNSEASSPVRKHNFILKMDVTIPARSESISPLVESVLAVVRETNIGKELEIETALREAVANAIKHGCCEDATKFVQCSVAFEQEGSVLIVVSDPGPGFNAQALPDPTTGEHLFENHGRGIFLINRLMDEVRFERNGAEIHMRKY